MAGKNRHWLLLLRKKTQYEVIRRLGRADEIFSLKTTSYARKQWPGLPTEITARQLTRKVGGKERQMLSSLTDHNRYPGNAISELYQHRWEIELGYRETKQDLVRYQMVRMAFHLKGNDLPYQLSLSGAISHITQLLITRCRWPLRVKSPEN